MLKRDLLANTIMLVIALTILYTFSAGYNKLTGYAVLNETSSTPGSYEGKIEGMLNSMPYVSVLSNTSICIVINQGNESASYHVDKKPAAVNVTKSDDECGGSYSQDFLIFFKSKEIFEGYATEPSCKKFVEGIGVDYEVFPSKNIEQGGNILCTPEFVDRFCTSFSQCVPEDDMIKADMSCCITHELTEEQKVLLKQHLASGRYIDETGADLAGVKLPDEGGIKEFLTGGNGILRWVLYIVIVIAIAAGGLFYFMKVRGVTTEEKAEGHPQLHDYFQQTLEQGYSFSQIKQALMEQGWPEDTIDKEIMDFYNKTQQTTAEAQNNNI